MAAVTVTVNDVVALLALESVAEHLTTVRPTLNWLPDQGMHVAGTVPSLASFAVTVKVTLTRFAPFGARTSSRWHQSARAERRQSRAQRPLASLSKSPIRSRD